MLTESAVSISGKVAFKYCYCNMLTKEIYKEKLYKEKFIRRHVPSMVMVNFTKDCILDSFRILCNQKLPPQLRSPCRSANWQRKYWTFFDQRLLLRQSNGIKIKISREPPIASLESNCENVLSSSEGVADVEFLYFFFDQTEPVVLAKVVIWDIG